MSHKFDPQKIREHFPVLGQTVYGKPLVYLDNGATSQTPSAVVKKMTEYYEQYRSNVNRGAHKLSERATGEYNLARKCVAEFIGADNHEIVFTKGTTEGINLVAQGLRSFLKAGDEIILSQMEHHANIVPWYMLAKELGLIIKVIPLTKSGELDIAQCFALFTKKTRVLGVCHASNVLGTINPIKNIINYAKERGVITVIDGAQAVPHLPVDVKDLGCDFYAFSGHKLYGPTGIGALYGREDWFDKLPPYQGGGDMIEQVSFDKIVYAKPPQKFEAGTPNISGALGLMAAIDYLKNLDLEAVFAHEDALRSYAVKMLSQFDEIRIMPSPPESVSLISFVIDKVHPHDISSILDREGIAIRSGHLCAEPLIKHLGVNAVCRVSFSFYNTFEEIDMLGQALKRVFEVFRR